VAYLKKNNKIGDILSLQLVEDYKSDEEAFSKKSLIILIVPEKVMNQQFRENLFNCLGENSSNKGYAGSKRS